MATPGRGRIAQLSRGIGAGLAATLCASGANQMPRLSQSHLQRVRDIVLWRAPIVWCVHPVLPSPSEPSADGCGNPAPILPRLLSRRDLLFLRCRCVPKRREQDAALPNMHRLLLLGLLQDGRCGLHKTPLSPTVSDSDRTAGLHFDKTTGRAGLMRARERTAHVHQPAFPSLTTPLQQVSALLLYYQYLFREITRCPL